IARSIHPVRAQRSGASLGIHSDLTGDSQGTLSPGKNNAGIMKSFKWSIVGVVAVLAVAVGGVFVYARVDTAPPKLALTTDSTTASTDSTAAPASASGDIAGKWRPTSKSVVGYRVNETLFGASNEAYGRTSQVAGSMAISGTTISSVDLTVDMNSVSSDRTQRDGQFRGRIMQTSTYPTATFK